MIELVLHLVLLHSPDGAMIYVNPQEVTSLRERRGDEHFTKKAECLIGLADGKFIAAKEDCETVRQKIEDGQK